MLGYYFISQYKQVPFFGFVEYHSRKSEVTNDNEWIFSSLGIHCIYM